MSTKNITLKISTYRDDLPLEEIFDFLDNNRNGLGYGISRAVKSITFSVSSKNVEKFKRKFNQSGSYVFTLVKENNK